MIHPRGAAVPPTPSGGRRGRLGFGLNLLWSEGGMIRLETLIELKFINSSCSSCVSY